MEDHGKRQIILFPAIVFIVGITSVLLLLWVGHLERARMERHNALLETVVKIKMEVAIFHLWLEEYLSGDITIEHMDLSARLESIKRRSDTLLYGGEGALGVYVKPLAGQEHRRSAEAVESLLAELESMAEERFRLKDEAGIGTEIDQLYDMLFLKAVDRLDALEALIAGDAVRDRTRADSRFMNILLLWSALIIAIVAALIGYGARQKRAEEEKRALQQEALRAAQLASLGELAAGVAHEINNPINGIINYADILKAKSTTAEGKDIADRIVREGERIADIVRSLLSFAREGSDEKVLVHLNQILSELMTLIGVQLEKDGITVDINIPGELPEVEVSQHQVAQVMLNVINNARYALNQKYPHADKNKVLEISGQEITHQGVPYARLTVRDNGTGIPEDIIEKVKTPFFTTKPSSKGTGLGLSISQSIIDGQNGKFSIESEAGKYTKVIIDLPIISRHAD